MITIARCKKILGKFAEKMTDSKIEQLRDTFVVLSDLAIDSYLVRRGSKLNEEVYGNNISRP